MYQFIFGIQYFAIFLLFVDLLYALCQKPSETQKHVVLLTISTLLMFVGYCIELDADNLSEALAGTAVSYIGKPYVMLSSFMMLCSYYDKKVSKAAYLILAVLSSFFSIIIFTNEYHHLYYTSTVFLPDSSNFSCLKLTRGPLYYSYIVASVTFFLACVYVIVSGKSSLPQKDRKRLNFYSAMMVFSGITGYVIYLTGRTGGYDSTMLGVFGSTIFLSLIFYRCRIFDVVTMAKDFALDSSPTALLVMNAEGRIIFTNSAADALLKAGLDADSVLSENSDGSIVEVAGRSYEILKKELKEKNYLAGTACELTDITDRHQYQLRLESEVKERTEKISNMQRGIIGSIANIVEARSVETGEHIRRTSEVAYGIAVAMKELGFYPETLTDEYIQMLFSAAPLHDIGKISVPDSILLKPGRLTQEEYEQMKIHVDSGAEVIASSMVGLESDEYVKMAIDIARFHHERWDGNGYTRRMRGEEIPLSARIVALADCFDAITSRRCYKEPIELETALQIIRSDSGLHFDPKVVEAFFRFIGRDPN